MTRPPVYNSNRESIVEAPVDTFQTVGDFDKGASFRDKRDRDLIKNPITLTKVKDFFKNTSSDFDFYFVNLKGRRSFAEKGDVSTNFIFKSYPDGLGLTPDQLRNGRINSDNITVFFVGNSAAEKIPMTAWTIAHRFGHSIRKDYAFTVLTDWLETEFESLLREYNLEKGKRSYGIVDSGAVRNYDKIKANLFNQVGTMRSARQSEINRPFEFYYELFAQYLKDGKVSLNKLTPSILKKYGSYGREEKMTTKNIDVVTDILHGIERDFPYYAEDVLNSCVGKIYVM